MRQIRFHGGNIVLVIFDEDIERLKHSPIISEQEEYSDSERDVIVLHAKNFHILTELFDNHEKSRLRGKFKMNDKEQQLKKFMESVGKDILN